MGGFSLLIIFMVITKDYGKKNHYYRRGKKIHT